VASSNDLEVVLMRFLTRALIVVAVGVLVMAAGRSPASPHGDDDNPGGAWQVELTRPDGAAVEVDLDAASKVPATDRDDDRRGDD
jgi:hypothetical protein